MKVNVLLLLLLLSLVGCSESKTVEGNDTTWSIFSESIKYKDQGLLNVESVLRDKDQNVLYLTSGKKYQPGTDGFISRISIDKGTADLKWVSGLNRPTGMAIIDSLLFVVDVNRLLVINTMNGQVLNRYQEPIPNSGLNDVAIGDPANEVYVTASFHHSIYKLENHSLIKWVKDTINLKWANGIVASETGILVGGLTLSNIEYSTRKVSPIHLESDVGDFDGLVQDGLGGYFVTTVENSALYYYDGKDRLETVMSGQEYFGNIDFDPITKRLWIPRGSHEASNYFLTELKLK